MARKKKPVLKTVDQIRAEKLREYRRNQYNSKSPEEQAQLNKELRDLKRSKRKFKSCKTYRLRYQEEKDNRKENKAITEAGNKVVENQKMFHYSVGEVRIKRYLIENNIKFDIEKKFPDLINPKTEANLRFDFYLPDFNSVIEYDGYQHRVKPKSMSLKHFKEGKERDAIKDGYCIRKGIKMIRIPSYDKDNISDILDNYLQHYEKENTKHRGTQTVLLQKRRQG